MDIAVTGSTGLIGTAFIAAAEHRGDRVVRVMLFPSQRVLPAVLLSSGYEFVHPTLDEALADLL